MAIRTGRLVVLGFGGTLYIALYLRTGLKPEDDLNEAVICLHVFR
jgi:hypothetical protein